MMIHKARISQKEISLIEMILFILNLLEELLHF